MCGLIVVISFLSVCYAMAGPIGLLLGIIILLLAAAVDR